MIPNGLKIHTKKDFEKSLTIRAPQLKHSSMVKLLPRIVTHFYPKISIKKANFTTNWFLGLGANVVVVTKFNFPEDFFHKI